MAQTTENSVKVAPPVPDSPPSVSKEDREFVLKERELLLREREMALKERDARMSRWSNPLVLAIFAAAIDLIGNLFVTRANNDATVRTEHVRSQSGLILEAIRTNGNTDTACKNLGFFVNLGLLDDPNHTIRGVCPTPKNGVPSLPAIGISNLGRFIQFVVLDASGNPIQMPTSY